MEKRKRETKMVMRNGKKVFLERFEGDTNWVVKE